MRLRKSRIEKMTVIPRIMKKNNEGSTYTAGGEPFTIRGILWMAGGKVQAKMYGEKLAYMANIKIDGVYKATGNGFETSGGFIREGDKVNVRGIDYRIIAIRAYRFLKLEVMRCGVEGAVKKIR